MSILWIILIRGPRARAARLFLARVLVAIGAAPHQDQREPFLGRLALAGRPASGDHGRVKAAEVLTQLERGDRATAVPRLGGMARADGVVIVGRHHWAFARTDGSLTEATMRAVPSALRGLPLARGLVRLAGSFAPLFRRRGVARGRERLFLAVAILLPLALAFAPGWVGLVGGIATTLALLRWLLRGRTLYLHGAEHRAIAALDERRLRETWGRRRASVALLVALRHQLRNAAAPRGRRRRTLLAVAGDVGLATDRLRARARPDDGAVDPRPGIAPARARRPSPRPRAPATDHS